MLYIPHSSDKTTFSEKPFLSFQRLYIPHSSDKTSLPEEEGTHSGSFTSHIVQIKHVVVIKKRENLLFFTSHIVQIKQKS